MDKATLLKGYLPKSDVELPSGTGTVLVRGLSRNEAVAVQAGVSDDQADAAETLEVRALARGMLDPALTEDEVREWRMTGLAADVQAVAQEISRLSNMDPDAGKGPTSASRRRRS